jgi:zinc finger protein
LLADIAKVKTGTFPITLILEDPSGNSGIVSERVVKEKYEPEDE